MENYIIYESDDGRLIAEVADPTDEELLIAQRSLINKGYLILETCYKYIKCSYVAHIEE